MTINKVAIIQARMSSSRLPGKVMLDIDGKPMLQRVIERVKIAKQVDQLVLATTTDPSDDLLEQFCQRQAIPCYRGSLPDVLDRFYQAAHQVRANVIIRLTADCPLLDPDVLDLTVLAFLNQHPVSGSTPHSTQDDSPGAFHCDFSADRLPPPWGRTLPIGLDVEVCSFDALERAWKEADQLYQREHVMPYLYENVQFSPSIHPDNIEWYIEQGVTPRGFRVALLNHLPDYGSLRWTVDTQADLEFVRQVYAQFEGQSCFDWQQVLALLGRQPELAAINAEIKHKSAYDVDQRTVP